MDGVLPDRAVDVRLRALEKCLCLANKNLSQPSHHERSGASIYCDDIRKPSLQSEKYLISGLFSSSILISISQGLISPDHRGGAASIDDPSL